MLTAETVIDVVKSLETDVEKQEFLTNLSNAFGSFVDLTFHNNTDEFFKETYASEAHIVAAKRSTAYRARDPYIVFGNNNRLISVRSIDNIAVSIGTKVREAIAKATPEQLKKAQEITWAAIASDLL